MEAEIICEENEDYLNTGRFPFHTSLHNVVGEVFTLPEELKKAFSKLFTTLGAAPLSKMGSQPSTSFRLQHLEAHAANPLSPILRAQN